MKKYLLLLICLTLGTSLLAQLRLPQRFQKALEQAEVSFAIPTENSYKKIRLRQNPIFNCDFAMRARRGKLEIRYALAQTEYPQVSCASLVTSLAHNESSSTIVIHDIPEKELREEFHADWGTVVYFQPKSQFSTKKHGKMIALYRAGKGIVYVVYLFNEVSEELEKQHYQLQFKK